MPLAVLLGPSIGRLNLGPRLTNILPGPHMALVLVLIASLLARVGWLDRPAGSLIFDETYYVNAARVILDRPVAEGAPYANSEPGIDPNREHPPLGKLLIAGSMEVFGDKALGWRFPSIVAGMLSILLVYGIVRAAGGDQWMGVLAAGLLGIENLALVHSRIGTLDMMLMAFMLTGAWCYLKGWPLLAGMLCAVAALMKLGGVYALLALFLIEFFVLSRGWLETGRLSRSSILTGAKLLASFAVVWLFGLWVLDLWVTNYDTPWEHLDFMLDYGFALTREGGPANQESYPWQWLVNDVEMTYLRVDERIMAGEELKATRPLTWFRGAMNPIVLGAAPLGLAFGLYRTWAHNDRLGLWVVAWFAGTFIPFVPASLLADRISYIFYILPTVPAFAIGLALLFGRGRLPVVVLWVFLLAVVVGFVGYYPIRRL
jgi:4-amino-4-deoxy-L-arabinose transferase-like glycosyltransferase